jgi:hypothetical protein
MPYSLDPQSLEARRATVVHRSFMVERQLFTFVGLIESCVGGSCTSSLLVARPLETGE